MNLVIYSLKMYAKRSGAISFNILLVVCLRIPELFTAPSMAKEFVFVDATVHYKKHFCHVQNLILMYF